jgi:MFS family permease
MRDPRHPGTSRLMLFFAVVYTVEGFCQAKVGVIWQPLTHYLKESQGWDAVHIATSLAVLDIPWVVKPLYGIVSDFVPLFGYRRRSYLLVANAVAVAVFLWGTQVLAPSAIIFMLLLSAVALAMASTVCGALLVENGQRTQASAAFINQQWLWFNIAVMAASIIGGELIEYLSPAGALHVALGIAAAVPVAAILSIRLVHEEHAGLNIAEFRHALRGLLDTFRSRTMWLVAGFLFLYYFSPGFGTPLYFYQTDHLHFSQGFIGVLASVSAAGWVAGGLIFRFWLAGLTTKALLALSIVGGTVGTLTFLGMMDEPTAVVVYFLYGVTGMIANIATLSLAADHCPVGSEGFAFAALMSVINLATPLADTIGSILYQHVFNGQLAPLIVVSAAATALILVLLPLVERATVPAR